MKSLFNVVQYGRDQGYFLEKENFGNQKIFRVKIDENVIFSQGKKIHVPAFAHHFR